MNNLSDNETETSEVTILVRESVQAFYRYLQSEVSKTQTNLTKAKNELNSFYKENLKYLGIS